MFAADTFTENASRERAIEHLVRGACGCTRIEPNPVGSFYFWNRTRRCIAVSPIQLCSAKTSVWSPHIWMPNVFRFSRRRCRPSMTLDHDLPLRRHDRVSPTRTWLTSRTKKRRTTTATSMLNVHFKTLGKGYSSDMRYAAAAKRAMVRRGSYSISRSARAVGSTKDTVLRCRNSLRTGRYMRFTIGKTRYIYRNLSIRMILPVYALFDFDQVS